MTNLSICTALLVFACISDLLVSPVWSSSSSQLSSLLSQTHRKLLTSPAKEYCERDYFEAACVSDATADPDRLPIEQVILVKSALYGRMKVGKCIKSDAYGSIGCQEDVISLVDARCTGRLKCRFPVTDLHDEEGGCPNDLMRYLEASYDCVPVVSCLPNSCHPGQSSRLKGSEGYLSSLVASRHGCGSADCPWVLEPLPGQKFNLTFFTAKGDIPSLSQYSGKQRPDKLCQRLASIVYVSSQVSKDVTSCGISNSERVIQVVTAASEKVEVKLFSGVPDDSVQYLVRYEVIGCEDMEAPANGHVKRHGDSLTVHCSDHQKVWHLTCIGTTWVGDIGTCPESEVRPSWSVHAALEKASTTTHGILLVVGLGIIIGVVIGCSLLAIVIVILKRRRLKQALEQERRMEMLTQYSLDLPVDSYKQQQHIHYQQQQQQLLQQQQQQQQQQQGYQDLPQTQIFADEEGGPYGGSGALCRGVLVTANCNGRCCASPRVACGQEHECSKNNAINRCKKSLTSDETTADIVRSLHHHHKDHTYESPVMKAQINNFNST